jgi:hypothetical protein
MKSTHNHPTFQVLNCSLLFAVAEEAQRFLSSRQNLAVAMFGWH